MRDREPISVPSGGLPTARPAALLFVVAALVLAAAWPEPFRAAARILDPAAPSFRELRRHGALQGLPIDRLGVALDRCLPRTAAIALAPQLRADAYLSQRLTEGLYPRVIDGHASSLLRLGPSAEAALASFGSRGDFHLDGPCGRPAYTAPAQQEDRAAFSWWGFLFAGLGVLGWGRLVGAGVMRASGAPLPPLPAAGAMVLCGYAGWGLLAHLATWTQTPLLSRGALIVGAVFALFFTGRFVRRHIPAAARAPIWHALRPRSPAQLLAVLATGWTAGFLFRTFWRFPVLGWDSRSIWMFRAHQLAQYGFFSLDDALRPTQTFAHPHYPLAFSAWAAAFGGSTPFSPATGWSERAAGASLAILYAGLLTLLFHLVRQRGGRSIAVVFTILVWLTALPQMAAGYADPVLAILIVTATLALAAPATAGLGLIALTAAALTKREGLLLGLIVAIVMIATARSGPHSKRQRFGVLAYLLPAALHAAWASLQDLPDVYTGACLPSLSAAGIGDRLLVIGGRFGRYTGEHPVAWAALAGTILSFSRAGMRATGATAVAGLLVVCAIFTLTPLELRWHLDAALSRLLLPLVLLGVLAGALRLNARDSTTT